MAACLLAAGPFACTFTTPAFETPGAGALVTLESRWELDPTDARSALSLAAGRLAEGDLAGAESVLQRTHDAVPSEVSVNAVLGLLEHELGAYLEADFHYQLFLEGDAESPLVPTIRARRDAIAPQVVRIETADLLARAAPAGEATAPMSVAVLPFAHDAGLPDGEAEGVALAELLSSDLRRLDLEVVDAVRGRAMIAAFGLASTQPVPIGAGARAAALFNARVVIFGRMVSASDDGYRIETTVLRRSADTLEVLIIPMEGPRSTLLDIQKRLSYVVGGQILGGVSLENAAILAPRDLRSVEAMASMGRGFIHRDAGRHGSAATELARASELEPSFERLTELARRADAARRVEGMSVAGLTVDLARVGEKRRAVLALRSRAGSAESWARASVGSDSRSVLTEVLGYDALGSSIPLEITFTLPGGS